MQQEPDTSLRNTLYIHTHKILSFLQYSLCIKLFLSIETSRENNDSTETDGSFGVQRGRRGRTRGNASRSKDEDAKYWSRDTNIGRAKFVWQNEARILRLKKDLREDIEESHGGGE